MGYMGKTLVINMDGFDICGDILDVCFDNNGVIYCISKEIEDELSIDYVEEGNNELLNTQKYDACTFFFNLNSVWSNRERKNIIKKVSNYLKEDGKIYLWDISKKRGQLIENKFRVKLPKNDFKEITVKNNNPLIECNFEILKKSIQKYYIIEESKEWEDMFYIRGTKKKST